MFSSGSEHKLLTLILMRQTHFKDLNNRDKMSWDWDLPDWRLSFLGGGVLRPSAHADTETPKTSLLHRASRRVWPGYAYDTRALTRVGEVSEHGA